MFPNDCADVQSGRRRVDLRGYRFRGLVRVLVCPIPKRFPSLTLIVAKTSVIITFCAGVSREMRKKSRRVTSATATLA